jgi:peptide chain release factor 1
MKPRNGSENLFERLELMLSQYQKLNEDLQNPEIVSNVKKVTELMKQMRSMEKVVFTYLKYKELTKTIADLNELISGDDKEIAEMAELELEEALQKQEAFVQDLKVLLIPKDPNDEKDVIVEIRGAAGGDEANIFAGDLFRMYSRYAFEHGWKIEVLSAIESEMGGFAQIEFMVHGDSVYSILKYESGSHRVQRVPETEGSGRIHTSTATVLVMPEADDIDVEMNLDEVRIDIFCSSGPGGQSVNTTKSAVRATHIPTGLVASCQDEKSQHENKARALKMLQTRLYDKIMQERQEKEGKERLSKIGTGDRSEKIRTYNYPQNRVTDHRIGFTIQQLDRVMEGKLDAIIEALITEDQQRILSKQE